LILGDYLKVYPFAQEIAEQATGLISWVNNHSKVRVIFNDCQATISQDRYKRTIILVFLVACITRWTTHCVAFLRLLHLKPALQLGTLQKRQSIIDAQIGAAKSTEKDRLEAEAVSFCNLIDDHTFWNGLEHVVGDMEPICYATNLNQKDSTRADQVLLSLVGIFLHFADHPEPEVRSGMTQRLEKRWADCDQPLFLLALILNPHEVLSCFGEKANFDPFKCANLARMVCTLSSLYHGMV
jgi:hypothetical protein